MSQNKTRASWTLNQALQVKDNGALRGAEVAGAGQRAFAQPESQGRHTGLPVSRGLSLVLSSLSLKRSVSQSQERHLRKTVRYCSLGSNTRPRRTSSWQWTRISAEGQRSPGFRSEKLVSRYPPDSLWEWGSQTSTPKPSYGLSDTI